VKTLQITEKSAISAYHNADEKGRKLLSDLFGSEPFSMNIMDRIKTFDDVLDYHGLSSSLFNSQCTGLNPDEIAYKQVKLIVSALNEGWSPDWTDGSQYKYFPWFKMSSSSGAGFAYHDCGFWTSNANVGSRLCFKSSELAKYAGNQFNDIYKNFFTL
jgi:hypothetical protein